MHITEWPTMYKMCTCQVFFSQQIFKRLYNSHFGIKLGHKLTGGSSQTELEFCSLNFQLPIRKAKRILSANSSCVQEQIISTRQKAMNSQELNVAMRMLPCSCQVITKEKTQVTTPVIIFSNRCLFMNVHGLLLVHPSLILILRRKNAYLQRGLKHLGLKSHLKLNVICNKQGRSQCYVL